VSQTETPADVCAEIKAMEEPWAIITALMGGTIAMREAGVKYLPRFVAESVEAYERRRKVAVLYGALRRTIGTMAGKPFAEPVKLGEDVPPLLVEHCNDVDLEGRDLQAFAHEVLRRAMSYGLSHILVDFPALGDVQTLADHRASGARPYFVHIDPRHVLGWRAERIAGVMTLTQFRFKECVKEPVGQWSTAEIEQVRVIDRNVATDTTTWTTYRTNDKGEWIEHKSGLVSINRIALATCYTARTGFMTAEPPLLDLAHLNVQHWQSDSDQQNILHVTRFPILFAPGFADEKLEIGANSAVTIDNTDADLRYVEHTGAAIGAGQESIDKLEARMSVMGLELLVSKPGTKTATEASIDTAESTSALAAMVNNLEDTLALALSFMAQWENLGDNGGTVKLNDDFGKLDPLDVQSLVAAKDAGILSAETIFEQLKVQGMVDEETTWEVEQTRLADDRTIAVEHAGASADAVRPPQDAAGSGAGGPNGTADGATSAGGAASAPAPDFGPLTGSIDALVKQLATPAEQIDLAGLVDAIKSIPAPVVNVPPPKDDSAMVGAVLAMADAVKNGPAPVINVTTPDVTVNSPAITVEAPAAPNITMPPVNVTIQKSTGEVTFTEDAAGNLTGAKLN